MDDLYQEKIKLESLVNQLKNINEIDTKIKQTAKREVEVALAGRRQLLKLTNDSNEIPEKRSLCLVL